MEILHKRVAGIDVHRMKHVVTLLVEGTDGQVTKQTREFGGFKRDLKALAEWLREANIELVILESTGIYWKSVYAHLENAGLLAWVVNAHHVKHVPGRKTDVADSEWLAQLGRYGLVRGSLIPPRDLRELRLVSRYRKKVADQLAAEKNRMHKLLDDAGIKLGGLVADINGKAAKAIVDGLIDGQPPERLILLAGRLKAPRDALLASLDGDLSARHILLLSELRAHVRYLEERLTKLDAYLIGAMAPYEWAFKLLQTLPGLDEVGAAMILVEIGDDLARFGSADRFASWAALCPGNHESAGKRKSGKTRKGNTTVRYLMCEAANAARRTMTVFKAKYQGLVVRRGHKKAIVAIAHKLIRTIYFMLTRRQAYRDSGFDYAAANVKKNAPRWLKALKRFGYWPEATSA
ncbi:MAG: transposase [Pseudomonadota bacterium]|nr:transposase [Pseudomonadota bacterium]